MTIRELRKLYPHSDFYFFENGREMRKAPFYHAKIKSFKVVKDALFIEM